MIRPLLLVWPALAMAAEPEPAGPEPTGPEGASGPAPVEDVVLPPLEDGFLADDDIIVDSLYDDLFAMGDEVAIEALVADNAFVMGREVHVRATVDGDLFVMGERIRIDAPVGGDVFALGKDLVVTPQGSIGGTVFALGGGLEVDGPVGGHLHGGFGKARLASAIGGDVDLEVGELEIGDGIQVAGDLHYATVQPVPELDAHVEGVVTFVEKSEEELEFNLDEADDPAPSLVGQAAQWTGLRLWDYVSKLLVGAAWLFVGGVSAAGVARTLREQPAESLGTGFLLFVGLPVAAFLCVITILPMSLGFFGFLAWGTMMFVGQLVVAQTLGDVMLQQLRPDAVGRPYVSLAVGLVPVVLAFGLPWVWFLAVVVTAMLGMGAMGLALRRAHAGRAEILRA